MPVCWAAGCNNRTGCKTRAKTKDATGVPIADDQPVRFHSFPLKNKCLLNQWIRNCGREGAYPSKASKICSVHFATGSFKEDMFARLMLSPSMRAKRQWVLKPEAVPTEFKHCLTKTEPEGTDAASPVVKRRNKKSNNDQNTSTPTAKQSEPASDAVSQVGKRRKKKKSIFDPSTPRGTLAAASPLVKGKKKRKSNIGASTPTAVVGTLAADATSPVVKRRKKKKSNIDQSIPTVVPSTPKVVPNSPEAVPSTGTTVGPSVYCPLLRGTSEEQSSGLSRGPSTCTRLYPVDQLQNVKEEPYQDLSAFPQWSVWPPVKSELNEAEFPAVVSHATVSEDMHYFGKGYNSVVNGEPTSSTTFEIPQCIEPSTHVEKDLTRPSPEMSQTPLTVGILVGPFENTPDCTGKTTAVESSVEYQRELNRFTRIVPKPVETVPNFRSPVKNSGPIKTAAVSQTAGNAAASVQIVQRQMLLSVRRERSSKSVESQTEDQPKVDAVSQTDSADTHCQQPQKEVSEEQMDKPYGRPILTFDDILFAFGNDHNYSCAARWARLLVKAAMSIRNEKMLGIISELMERLEGLLDNGTDDVFCSIEHLLSSVHQQRIQLHHLMGVVTKLEKENSTIKAEISRFSESIERMDREGLCGDVRESEKFDATLLPGGTKKCPRPDRKRLLKELSSVDLNIELIKQDPKLCRRYTGFPNYYLFNAVFSTLETEVTTKRHVPQGNIGNTGYEKDTNVSVVGNEETTRTKECFTSQNQKVLIKDGETSQKSSSIFPTVLKKTCTVQIERLQQSPDETQSRVQTQNRQNISTSPVQIELSRTSICKPNIGKQNENEYLAQAGMDTVINSETKVLKDIHSNLDLEKSHPSTFRCLSLKEEFLAALIRIKTDFPLAHLARKFNVSVSGMDRLTTKWAHFLLSSLVDFQDVPEFGFTTQLRTLVKRFILRSLRGHLKSQSSLPKQLDSSDSAPAHLEDYTISANW